MERLIIELVRSALYCKHSVAAEVVLSMRSAREGYEGAVTRPARTEAQHRMFKSIADRNSERLAQLTALQSQYASLRGELGALPAAHDTAAKCDPELAAMARATEDEVFARAVRSLGGG
jgi:hypothetical protein